MSIVLLEHPRPKNHKRFEDVVNTPLSSCLMTGYIASTLKLRQHDVEIIDANLHEWSFYKTIQELKKENFSLLGVHIVYLWENTEDVFEMLLNLRKNGVDAHINLYGHFPTFAFEEILANYPFVDSVTIGEPETTFLELAEAIINCKSNSILYSIEGLAFNSFNSKTNPPISPFVKFPLNPPSSPFIKGGQRGIVKGGEGGLRGNYSGGLTLDKHGAINSEIEGATLKPDVIKNKPRKPVSNLDELPFPYRNDFNLSKKKGIATYILASRGCYGKCTFCYLDRFYGDESYWRGRSPENIIDEICHISKIYGERFFYFADANFFGPGGKGKERACELARLIMDKGLDITFGIECRVNDVEEVSISKLVRAGLEKYFWVLKVEVRILWINSGNLQRLRIIKRP
ncbi:MAG: hypothetical protein SCARUB_02426 [Candidatus Scalindua rubra]|uniref:B12-binding domain-containing protein n=1 Tax=Candidatus Scalindua rubra TaxID=1872076 RepID=A0A1E3X9Z6_9BACT|nr:MAG: hypothetical protein SCARUB_02426 [Candidatus Scalindua rubra]